MGAGLLRGMVRADVDGMVEGDGSGTDIVGIWIDVVIAMEKWGYMYRWRMDTSFVLI